VQRFGLRFRRARGDLENGLRAHAIQPLVTALASFGMTLRATNSPVFVGLRETIKIAICSAFCIFEARIRQTYQ
jgi:hypothetical protein